MRRGDGHPRPRAIATDRAPVLGFDLAPGDRIPPVGMVGVDLPPYRRYVGELQALAAAIRGEAPLPVTAGVERIVQETVLRASGMA